MATITACPFCFHKIDSSRLAYQCSGRGNKTCERAPDADRKKLTGNPVATFCTFLPEPGRGPAVIQGNAPSALCPKCGGTSRRRACPKCHTALPIDFVGTKNPMIGLVGSKGSGKTVLMTVLVRQMREVVGRRYDADIRIATDNPDGHQGMSEYQASRERPLYSERSLPAGTSTFAFRKYATPIVLRWRQEKSGRFGTSLKSTMLSLVDSAGEDLNNQETAFTLQYLSICDSLIITLDPFALPGARDRLKLPKEATQVGDDVPLDVVDRITQILRTEHEVRNNRKIKIPIAIVFTKIDAFYPTLDPQNRIMAAAPAAPWYDEADGQAVHEHMLALLREWHAENIDTQLRNNYADYRYFGVSALGAEPDYADYKVAAGGVQPHRVEDPVLWLLSKAGTVRSA